MRYLFNFIHPAKFHAFRITINQLLQNGHNVDIVIISKDIVEELVKNEGWKYTNIFPEGRRIPHLHTYLSAGINLLRTIYRLLKFMNGKQFDLIITDDLATIAGRLKRIPSIFFTDDDLKAVPESVILIASANYVLCPAVAYMGKYSKKKIGYYGLKSLGHLHPNHFVPDRYRLIPALQNEKEDYFFIRCVSATSTHDVGKKGLGNSTLIKLVTYLEKYGKVIINSQRVLPDELKKYALNFNKMDIGNYLFYAKMFISDSTTMCAEACILGTPSIEFDDWFSDFEQYKELNSKYQLLFGFLPGNEEGLFKKIDELLNTPQLYEVFQKRRQEFLKNNIDLSSFMIWLFENYPISVRQFLQNPNIQNKYK